MIENSFENNEIDLFLQNTFNKLNITGKILEKLKTSDDFWKKFEAQITKNGSFGMSVAIASAIQSLL